MAKCTNCGADVTDKMKFCSECGTRVPTDKECPECHTRCALAAKFCSECGHDFSKPVEEDADDIDDDSEEDTSPSGHYSVVLKDCGEDKGAVLRDLVEMTGKRLWPDISDVVSNLPAVVAEGLARDEADKYALVLKIDGAEAEVVADGDGDEDGDSDEEDEEDDASSGGHYSVRIKDWSGSNKGAVLRDLVEITGLGLMAINDKLKNLPAVIAEGISHGEADKYALALKIDGAEAEVVADDDGDGDDDSDEEDDSPSEPYPEMVDIPGRNFKLGCTPVTQAQWEAVMGYNPSYFTYKGANRPVEQVSWDDCQEFIEKLNEETGMNFRFPTQKEWEYACRAGSKGDYGLVEGGEEGDIDDMGWYDGNSDDETHPVAQKQPNAWGLYDMHGNVSTWCADASGRTSHVVCGGGFNFDADSCTATYRNGCESDTGDNWIGLRLAMDCESDTDEETSEEETSEEKESSSGDGGRPSRTCIVDLKDVGSDRNAVIRELRTLLNKTYGDAKAIVENAPTTLHFDCFREKAEEIAAALEAVGATVELIDKDAGTKTSGNCSVVLKKLPFMVGRLDKMLISAEVAQLMGALPANAWKMLDDLPLTIAENISREEAEEIVSKLKAKKCSVEIV